MTITLINAARDRNLNIIRSCLSNGENINFCDHNGSTALIWAASYGFIEIVEFLLSQNANYELRNKVNETAFLSAIVYGKLNVAKYLFEHKRTQKSELEEGLLAAAKVGNIEAVQFLMSLPISFTQKNDAGRNAFLVAVENGYHDIVQYMFRLKPEDCIKSTDNQDNSALHIAISCSQATIIDYLLEQASDVFFLRRNKEQLDGYGLAIKLNRLAIAQRLLKKGCYIDFSIFSERLQEAHVRRLYNGAAKLFRVVAAPKDQKELSLYMSLLKGCLNGRHVLDGNSALHVAVSRGLYYPMFILLHHGANLDLRNKQNMTPYQMAILNQNPFVQLIAHFFKTIQLIKQTSIGSPPSMVLLKPLDTDSNKELKGAFESKNMVEMRMLESPAKEKGTPNKSQQTFMIKPFETLEHELAMELKITVQKLNQANVIYTDTTEIKCRLISYMYLELGELLYDKKPQKAGKLLQNVREISGTNYFETAQIKMYYLIKLDTVRLINQTDLDSVQFKIFILISKLLYARQEQDNEGMTIQQYIQEFTKETVENIQKLGLQEILKQDSVGTKKNFLNFLKLLREKNLREQSLQGEIARLREELRLLNPLILDKLTSKKETTPLQPIPESRKMSWHEREGGLSPLSSLSSLSGSDTPIRIKSPFSERDEERAAVLPRGLVPGTEFAYPPIIYTQKMSSKIQGSETTHHYHASIHRELQQHPLTRAAPRSSSLTNLNSPKPKIQATGMTHSSEQTRPDFTNNNLNRLGTIGRNMSHSDPLDKRQVDKRETLSDEMPDAAPHPNLKVT